MVDRLAVGLVPDVACDFVPAARWCWDVVRVPKEDHAALRLLARVVQAGVPVDDLVLE